MKYAVEKKTFDALAKTACDVGYNSIFGGINEFTFKNEVLDYFLTHYNTIPNNGLSTILDTVFKYSKEYRLNPFFMMCMGASESGFDAKLPTVAQFTDTVNPKEVSNFQLTYLALQDLVEWKETRDIMNQFFPYIGKRQITDDVLKDLAGFTNSARLACMYAYMLIKRYNAPNLALLMLGYHYPSDMTLLMKSGVNNVYPEGELKRHAYDYMQRTRFCEYYGSFQSKIWQPSLAKPYTAPAEAEDEVQPKVEGDIMNSIPFTSTDLIRKYTPQFLKEISAGTTDMLVICRVGTGNDKVLESVKKKLIEQKIVVGGFFKRLVHELRMNKMPVLDSPAEKIMLANLLYLCTLRLKALSYCDSRDINIYPDCSGAKLPLTVNHFADYNLSYVSKIEKETSKTVFFFAPKVQAKWSENVFNYMLIGSNVDVCDVIWSGSEIIDSAI